MPLHHRIRLMSHLTHGTYQPSPVEQIMEEMRIEPEEAEEFKEAVRGLRSDGRIVTDVMGRVMLAEMPDEITGMIKINPRGFGFVVPDETWREGDLFVPGHSTGDAVSRDKVRVQVIKQSGRGGRGGRGGGGGGGASGSSGGGRDLIGRVLEVIERGRSQFTGNLSKYGPDWVVEPDGKVITTPIIVRDPEVKGAKLGDKVVVEITHYPEGGYNAEGVITKVLGDAGRPDVETQAIIEGFGLPDEFPEGCIDEAREAAQRFDAETAGAPTEEGMGIGFAEREDLTDTFVFTIDPQDSKDFDDAISLEFDEKRREWVLGVHIADVAHFVRPGGDLDVEAKKRGNSCYLPRLVIPMLPEVLSNGICSLHEGVPRFCKSAFVRFDSRGKVTGSRYSATVIKSAKRMTYEEAQALIEGDEVEARKQAKTDTEYTDKLRRAVKMAETLARTLRGRRQRDGMISLNLPDVELVFDDQGNVIDAEPEDDSFTHTVIEMFMVEANEAIARLFANLGVPVLRRTHPDPSFGDVEELRKFSASIGFPLSDQPDRQDIQRLLDRTREDPAARAIHFAVLRTLTKASYSPAMIGHFALASHHYAHFTSPIRRYPDLQVHRCLEAFLQRTENGTKVPKEAGLKKLGKDMMEDHRCPPEDALIALGRACSGTEDNATAAERELRSFLVLSFLAEHHLGHEFDAVVTGVTGNAIFVSIERYLQDAMAKVAELPAGGAERSEENTARAEREKERGPKWEEGSGGGGDAGRSRGERWKIDDKTGRLVAGSGASIGMGDLVKVRVDEVDLGARHVNVAIVEMSRRMAHRPPGEGGGGGDGEADRGGQSSYDSKRRAEQGRQAREKGRRDRERRKDRTKRGGRG